MIIKEKFINRAKTYYFMTLTSPSNLHQQQISSYLASLRKEVHQGLISQQEYESSVRMFAPKTTTQNKPKISIEYVSENETTQRLENLYYRELFGRKRDEDDEHLDNEIMLGKLNDKPAGALWYSIAPTLAYKGCMYLDMLLVLNEFRNTGLGTQLMLNLLEQTSPNQCIITYAWKPAMDFYSKHGFLIAEETDEKGGQIFQKMVLPLTKRSFERYCREKEGNRLEGLDDMISLSHPTYDMAFLNSFVNAIDNLKPHQERDFSLNPFTVFLYHRAGLDHVLLRK